MEQHDAEHNESLQRKLITETRQSFEVRPSQSMYSESSESHPHYSAHSRLKSLAHREFYNQEDWKDQFFESGKNARISF